VKRREFITLLGGAAVAWPVAARAQQSERGRRIGVLMSLASNDRESPFRVAALQQALEQLGWTAGRNIRIDYRWTGGDANLTRTFAKELVELKPDVIIGVTTPLVAAILRETRTVPVVFVQVIDPIRTGLVPSLANPGGNITGFTNFEFSMGSKWLGLLKEISPRMARVAILFNPEIAQYPLDFLRLIDNDAPSFAITPIAVPVSDPDAIETSVGRLIGEPNLGLLVLPDLFMSVHRERAVATAARHGIPAIYPFRYFAESGGLVSYGIDSSDLFRRAADYADRILKGAKPGDLPVQLPTKFELVINLKTAKALGLTVPDKLLALADEVIE
jgi:putative tryptophan/tyrosine transport system substrate-binding protein